jgi:hypothetical protein
MLKGELEKHEKDIIYWERDSALQITEEAASRTKRTKQISLALDFGR